MKLQKITLLAFFALMGGLASAQVKVGTNPGTIGSSSNLEVEASGGKKLTVDKTSGALSTTGTVTVADGSQGAGKVLTSDANGLATWSNLSLPTSVIAPTYSGTNGSVTVKNDLVEVEGGTLTFPSNGIYIFTWDVTGDLAAEETSPSTVFIVRTYDLNTGSQTLGDQQPVTKGTTIVKNAGTRIVEITNAPVTYSLRYATNAVGNVTTRQNATTFTAGGNTYWNAIKLK